MRALRSSEQRNRALLQALPDTLFIVASCNQDFNVPRLERYLVLAGEVGVKPVVVLTKTDLTDRPDTFAERARGLQPDLTVESVNARDPASVARLAAWCGKGETVALYATGEGQTMPGGADGKVTATPPVPRLPVTVTIGGNDLGYMTYLLTASACVSALAKACSTPGSAIADACPMPKPRPAIEP